MRRGACAKNPLENYVDVVIALQAKNVLTDELFDLKNT